MTKTPWLSYLLAALLLVLASLPLLLINGLQAISYLALRWLAPKRYFAAQSRIAAFYWGSLVRSLRALFPFKLIIEGDRVEAQENAILFANHQSGVDTVLLLVLAHHFGRVGDVRYFVKDILKYIPAVGWGMWFLGCLFLKRDWQRDRRRIEKAMGEFKQAEAPLWLILFPEGTRLTREKLLDAQEWARRSGRPIPQNVLEPHARGLHSAICRLEGHVQVVYDVTIAYPDGAPTLIDMLSGRLREVCIHVKKVDSGSLPRRYRDLHEWLQNRFHDKDVFLSSKISKNVASLAVSS